MTQENPDQLRQKAKHYERIADRMLDERALQALNEMAGSLRARADELSRAEKHRDHQEPP